MTPVDIGAGTGAFAAAFSDWSTSASSPSSRRRRCGTRSPGHRPSRCLRELRAPYLCPDDSADAAWLSLVIQHIPDLGVAAHEIRRVLRPGAPILIRQGFPGRLDRVELIRLLMSGCGSADTPRRCRTGARPAV